MIAKSYMSNRIHSYVVFSHQAEFMGAPKMWRAVVSTLLETPCHIHSGFIAFPIGLVVFERVVVYEIDTERLVDAAGIRGLGKDEKSMEK